MSRARIVFDEATESPREWDNLGTIAYSPRSRYSLGDVAMHPDDERIADAKASGVCLPVYAYIHSGVALSLSPFSCPWDSGQSGYIFASREKILSAYGRKRITRKLREATVRRFAAEIETFAAFLAGECYGIEILDDSGDVVDSCYGFLGDVKTSGILDYAPSELRDKLANADVGEVVS